jgi:outer membrane usher protein
VDQRQRVETLQLAPGRYDIRNFPLALGTNDLLLRITDEVGREETVRFPFVFDSSLLAAGRHDFSYAAGVLSRRTPEGRAYDFSDPAFSAFHAVGLTDQITAGGTGQGSRRQQTAGAEGRWAAKFGTLRADFSLSRADFAANGSAARLQYRYLDMVSGGNGPSWTAAATYRSPAFTALGDTAANNPYALELGLTHSRRLLWELLGILGLGRQLGRDGLSDGTSSDLTLYRSFRRQLLASLLLSRRYPGASRAEDRAQLSLTWTFGELDVLTASQDTAAEASRVNWRHSASRRVRSAESDIGVTRDRAGAAGRGELRYRDYRFSAGAAVSVEKDRLPGSDLNDRLSLNFGTALAFADGRAALSRPITDSFVIIAQHSSLTGRLIEVNSVSGIPEARTGPLGPAVLPEILSYQEHSIELDAPDLPPWTNLGTRPRSIYPAYRSGTLLIAGTAASVIIQGRLTDAAGRALPSEAGDLTHLEDQASPAIGFFTSRTGHFTVEGLKPGRWNLVLRNYPANSFLLTIKPGQSGMTDIGTLRLSPRK